MKTRGMTKKRGPASKYSAAEIGTMIVLRRRGLSYEQVAGVMTRLGCPMSKVQIATLLYRKAPDLIRRQTDCGSSGRARPFQRRECKPMASVSAPPGEIRTVDNPV